MTRTKTVYHTGEIAHLWANQSVKYARNPQNNFFFEGETLYSYGHHHAVAALYPDKGVCLFNSDTVSNTTAGHHREACAALHRLGYTRFSVASPTRPADPQNFREYGNRIHNLEEAAEKPRRPHRTKLQDRVRSLEIMLGLHEYCRIFRCKGKAMKANSTCRRVLNMTEESIRALKNNYADELEPLQAEADAASRARMELRWARNQAEREEIERIRNLEAKEKEAEWRQGIITRTIGPVDGGYILRLRTEKESTKVIETSGGARVGVIAAKLVWKLVRKCKLLHKPYKVPPEKPVRVGFYTLHSIEDNGDVQIGCHKIYYDEMAAMAKQLGWLKEAEHA